MGGKRNSLPMLETKATISTPEVSWRIFSAIAPAATRPINLDSVKSFQCPEEKYRRTNCFSRTGSTTTTTRSNAVLHLVRQVGMVRPWILVHGAVPIVLGPLIFVHDPHRNRCPKRDAMFCSRLYLYLILFITRRGYGALAGPSPCELRLDV